MTVLVHDLGADAFPEIGSGEEPQPHPVLLFQRLLEAEPADPAQGFQRYFHGGRRFGVDRVGRLGGLSSGIPAPGPQPTHDLFRIVARIAGVKPFPLRRESGGRGLLGEAFDGGVHVLALQRPGELLEPRGRNEVVREAEEQGVGAAQVRARQSRMGAGLPW